jgi:hypothetical protein
MKKKSKRPRKLLTKIKRQLAEFQKPVWESVEWDDRRFRSRLQISWNPTVEEYQRLDPFWLSTMGGAFAGRGIGK